MACILGFAYSNHFFGILPGVDQAAFIKAFEHGFGKTLGKIGVVIVLGAIIA